MLKPEERAKAEQRKQRLIAARNERLESMSEESRRVYEKHVSLPLLQTGKTPSFIDRVFAKDYLEKPISVREFILNDYFLGRSLRKSMYPILIDKLEEMFDGNYSEALLMGALGWGKTRLATVGMAYDIYRLICLRDPASIFGVPGSALTFVNISARLQQAKNVFFAELYGLLHSSPYFRERCQFRKNLRNEIQFLRDDQLLIYCHAVAANEQSVLGESIFSAVIDEANFMDLVDRSRRSRPGDAQVFSQAEEVYNRISARIRGRLLARGHLPGHLWVMSSARYPNDFTEKKMLAARRDRSIFALKYAVWDTKPHSRFTCNADGSLKCIQVVIGDRSQRSHILSADETQVDPARIINVPVDLRQDFERDPDRALRDFAGVSTLSINPFIVRYEMIQKMFTNGAAAGLRHPLTHVDGQGCPTDVTLQEPSQEGLQFIPQNLHSSTQHLRYAHVDLSRTRDATGVVVGHVRETKKVSRWNEQANRPIDEKLPVMCIDLVLRVVPPLHGEIDIPRIRAIFYRLRELGMEFGLITFDAFGSQESIKTLKDSGFRSGIYSLDREETGISAYEVLKCAIYDERLLCYPVPKLQDELASLEWHGNKVDHPSTPGASKDLADCLAAVVNHCEQGWRSGEGRGLFKLGIVEPLCELPTTAADRALQRELLESQPLSASRSYAKIELGIPLSSADEEAIVFAPYLSDTET